MYLQKRINSFKNLFLTGAFLLFFIFNASNTFADFYVIAGSKVVGTKINSLPYKIESSGFYFITKDLSCAAGNYGIEITADDVTLDLMGFSLVGPDGSSGFSGIHMSGRTNVEIRNGTVRNFANHGIYEGSATNGRSHRIINIRANNNHTNGICLNSFNNLVEKCTATNNGDNGIRTGSNSTVIGNICCNNTDRGIIVVNGCTVKDNTCNANTTDGIYASYACTLTGNTCYSNSNYGIYVVNYCLVSQNTSHANTTADISSCNACEFSINIPNI